MYIYTCLSVYIHIYIQRERRGSDVRCGPQTLIGKTVCCFRFSWESTSVYCAISGHAAPVLQHPEGSGYLWHARYMHLLQCDNCFLCFLRQQGKQQLARNIRPLVGMWYDCMSMCCVGSILLNRVRCKTWVWSEHCPGWSHSAPVSDGYCCLLRTACHMSLQEPPHMLDSRNVERASSWFQTKPHSLAALQEHKVNVNLHTEVAGLRSEMGGVNAMLKEKKSIADRLWLENNVGAVRYCRSVNHRLSKLQSHRSLPCTSGFILQIPIIFCWRWCSD